MYGSHLAWIHRQGFSGFIREVSPALLGILRRRCAPGSHVLDLGCGDGAWLRALTAAGFRATGLDQSAAFVAMARRAAPGAAVLHGSVYGTLLPPAQGVTAVGEVFNYLPLAGRAPSFLDVCRRVSRALQPGGVFIFDVLVSGRPMRYERWRTGRGWAVLVRVTEDVGRGRVTREIVSFRRRGTAYTRQNETHVLRVFERDHVTRALRRVGFEVRSSRRCGAVPLAPRRVAFVATKQAAPINR